MNTINALYAKYEKVKLGSAYIACTMLLVTMVYITADVIVRNFTPFALVGTYEIIQNYLMPLIGFPALGFAYSSGIMPRIIMLTDKLSPRYREILAILIPLIHGSFFAAMAYFSLQYAIIGTIDKSSFICGTAMLPLYPMYYLPVFGFVLLLIEDIFIFLKNILIRRESVLFTD